MPSCFPEKEKDGFYGKEDEDEEEEGHTSSSLSPPSITTVTPVIKSIVEFLPTGNGDGGRARGPTSSKTIV